MDKDYLIELVRDNPDLWDQRTKNYYNRDRKTPAWNSVGEKLNVDGKFALLLFIKNNYT